MGCCKYITGSNGGAEAKSSGICDESVAESGAVAFDGPTWLKLGGLVVGPVYAKMCWSITGKPVIINDTTNSIMHGFEVVNYDFGVDGDQPCVACNYDLPCCKENQANT